jgi:hypothetical protein
MSIFFLLLHDYKAGSTLPIALPLPKFAACFLLDLLFAPKDGHNIYIPQNLQFRRSYSYAIV